MPIVTATDFLQRELDYIVVGGGTTGIALAVRYVSRLPVYVCGFQFTPRSLTENPGVTVGVLEAGDYDPDVPQINTPGEYSCNADGYSCDIVWPSGMRGLFLANPKYDWTFMSTPQKHAHNRQVLQHRGKALGGSSMV
jgi:choline dehydrogenase-like flavoprotein